MGTIIRVADGRIVLVKRAIEPGYGKWVFPGGYVDFGENSADAAVRETLESGAPYELELEMIRADGTTCWTTTRG